MNWKSLKTVSSPSGSTQSSSIEFSYIPFLSSSRVFIMTFQSFMKASTHAQLTSVSDGGGGGEKQLSMKASVHAQLTWSFSIGGEGSGSEIQSL